MLRRRHSRLCPIPGLRWVDALLLAAFLCSLSAGATLADSKFGLTPLPLVHGRGTVWVVMDRLGQRVLYSVTGRPESDPVLHNLDVPPADYLYDIRKNELRVVRRSSSGTVAISGNGLRGFRFGVPSTFDLLFRRNEVIDLEAWISVGLLPTLIDGPCTGCYSAGVVDDTGDRYVYKRNFGAVTLWERGVGIRHVSPQPQPGRRPVVEPVLSRDGKVVAFISDSEFDPTATTGGTSQIYIYDVSIGELRQLTGRDGEGYGGARLRLSADGSRVSHQPTDRLIEVLDTIGGEVVHRFEVAEQFEFGDIHLSDDGNVLAFMTAADLDPRVGNPRLWSQLFRADLSTGEIDQVTQVHGPAGWFMGMDGEAKTFVLVVGGLVEIDGVQMHAGSGSIYRERRPGNRPPVLTAPETVYAVPGEVTRFSVSASDPDGDPLSFYAELESAETTFLGWAFHLGMEIEDIVDADGDGQTAISLRPGFDHDGYHRLKVAVFDGVGGAALRVVDLHVAYAGPAELDMNCDHRFDAADLHILALDIFTPMPVNVQYQRKCNLPPTDTNGDGVTSAADVVGLALMYDPPSPGWTPSWVPARWAF